MFYGTDLDPVLFETGTHPRIANHEGSSRDIHGFRQVDAAEDDAGIGRGRAQGHVDLDAAMQAHAGSADDGLERALL